MELEEFWKFVWCLVVLNLTKVLGFEGEWTIPLEHAFGGGAEEENFRSRGSVKLVQSRPGGPMSGRYIQDSVLSLSEKRSLLKSAMEKGFYRIRSPTLFTDRKIDTNGFILSFTEACRVVKSELSDILTLSVDSSKQTILSITVQPYLRERSVNWNCESEDFDSDANLYPFDVFNTTVRITDIVEGPVPEAQAYIQKREKEDQERKRGEQAGDNRSFFAKYMTFFMNSPLRVPYYCWMYILPVVIFVMFSGAMNPEPQTQQGR